MAKWKSATIADLKAKMEKIQEEIKIKERKEREKIGAEMQKLTGLETWNEIENVIKSHQRTAQS
ncbi:MAG: hypothetical protein IKN12_04790 [Selenomonadaceae bacterium]|nr:hypothetical protein [Selenomonadaceae bacterium]